MDVLNSLKFWRRAAMAANSTSEPRLGVEPDDGREDDDSFFDLEFTVYTHENSIRKSNVDPEDKIREGKEFESGNDQVSRKLISLSANESISKRKILPIEPVSKPQSPIALLKSAPSFRVLMFKKKKEPSSPRKTEEMEDSSPFSSSLSRSVSTSRSHGSRSERFSKEVLQKYLNLIKPLYVKISGKNGEKVKLSGDLSSASTTSSPSVASVSSKREKQGNIPAGIRGACKHLGKSKSASTINGIGSPARKSDDTLQLQYDGIQSAILHCKRSFNSREYTSTITQSEEKSTCLVSNETRV